MCPEISEAQAAVNQLNPLLHGATIMKLGVAPWYQKARDAAPLLELEGKTCSGVSRHAKSILFEFQNPPFPNKFLLSRLGMTGHWLVRQPSEELPQHWVVWFALSLPRSAAHLLYVDTRQFGTLEVAGSAREFGSLRSLGPDLLSDQFSPEWVLACAKRHTAPLKALLLRPEYFPGVGNWVANEALFRANLAPQSPSRGLTAPQAVRLVSALILTIRNAITKGGATLKDWRLPSGEPGRAQEDFAVYGREGRPCLVCATKIAKVVITGRATFLCGKCQSGEEQAPVSDAFVQAVLQATEGG